MNTSRRRRFRAIPVAAALVASLAAGCNGSAPASTTGAGAAGLAEPSATSAAAASRTTASAIPVASQEVIPSTAPEQPPDKSAGWAAAGTMTSPRAWHTATLLADGRVLVAGGLINDRLDGVATDAAEVFDPRTSTWTATGHMAHARFHHTATLLADGSLLVVGGNTNGGGGAALKSAELYDPVSGKWTTTHDLATPRAGHTATRLSNGTVLVVGGGGETTAGEGGPRSATAELYDPVTRTWRPTDAMTEPRTSFTATLLRDGSVLVAGGGAGFVEAERYDPSTGTWTATGSMAEGRWRHSATLLADGTVLVAGGCACTADPDERSARTEIYDPDSGAWRTTGSMTSPRVEHLAVALLDGDVLVVNGAVAGGDDPSAELYDPRADGWRAIANPARARIGATLTLLDDGRALLSGDDDEVGKGSAELFGNGTQLN